MEGQSTCSPLMVPDQGLSLWKKRAGGKAGRHKQEHTETQTWLTNGEGDRNENLTWTVTLTDKTMCNVGMYISVRWPDRGPCQMEY